MAMITSNSHAIFLNSDKCLTRHSDPLACRELVHDVARCRTRAWCRRLQLRLNLVPLQRLDARANIGARSAPENTMKIQKLLIALTVVNVALLTFSLARTDAAGVESVAPVLRGRAL